MRIGIFLLLKISIISCYIPVEAKSLSPKEPVTNPGLLELFSNNSLGQKKLTKPKDSKVECGSSVGGVQFRCGSNLEYSFPGKPAYECLKRMYDSGIIGECPSSLCLGQYRGYHCANLPGRKRKLKERAVCCLIKGAKKTDLPGPITNPSLSSPPVPIGVFGNNQPSTTLPEPVVKPSCNGYNACDTLEDCVKHPNGGGYDCAMMGRGQGLARCHRIPDSNCYGAYCDDNDPYSKSITPINKEPGPKKLEKSKDSKVEHRGECPKPVGGPGRRLRWTSEGDYCVIRYKRETAVSCSTSRVRSSCRSTGNDAVYSAEYTPKKYERLKRMADSGVIENCHPPFETHGNYCVRRMKKTDLHK